MATFKDLWMHRCQGASSRAKALRRILKRIDRDMEQLVEQVDETDNRAAVSAYEKRRLGPEEQKIVLSEKIERFERIALVFGKSFKTALKFLANTYTMRVSGDLEH